MKPFSSPSRFSTARIILIAFTFSTLGGALAGFALPVVYIAQTENLTRAGILAASAVLAGFIGGLMGGIIADALSKRVFLFLFGCLDPLFWIAIAVLVWRENYSLALWIPLVVLAMFFSAAEGTIEGTSLRLVVQEDEVAEVMSLRQTRAYMGMFLGPVLGGVFASISPSLPFLVTAIMGVLCMLVLIPAWGDEQLGKIVDKSEGNTKTDAIFGGLHDVARDPILLMFAVIFVLIPFALDGVLEVFTFGLAHEQVEPWIISVFPVAVGLGGLLGASLVPLALRKITVHAGQLQLMVQSAILFLALGMAFIPIWPIRLVLMALTSFIVPFANPFMSFFMAYVPRERQGRVTSVITAINSLPGLFTAPIVAMLLPFLGYRTTAILAIPIVLATVALFFMPALRNIPATDGWADYVTELRTPSGDPVVELGTSQEEHS